MRRQGYALAAVAACLLIAPGAEASPRHTHRVHRAALEQPTSVELLNAMQAAADEWWTAQGSPPPCSGSGTVEWGTIGDASASAVPGTCAIKLSPHWWATQYAFVTGRYSRRARVRAAAEDLALVMHERGHDLGYLHIPGTVMQALTPVVPGWAFEWAARTVR